MLRGSINHNCTQELTTVSQNGSTRHMQNMDFLCGPEVLSIFFIQKRTEKKKKIVDPLLSGNATNPYTNQTLPYIGYVETSDYLTDTLLPSMLTLASMGTEIMWCE